MIEQKEAANEELRAANEEVISANEELQSTNEELTTAKEELQAYERGADDRQRRAAEPHPHHQPARPTTWPTSSKPRRIPIVVLGTDLCIRRFTPAAQAVMNLRPGDVGRPLVRPQDEDQRAQPGAAGP